MFLQPPRRRTLDTDLCYLAIRIHDLKSDL